MTAPTMALLGSSIRSWLSAKGFWLVAAAALLPLVLTGAYVATHRADIALDRLDYDQSALVAGKEANFTTTVSNPGTRAVASFNVTFAVGPVNPISLTLTPEKTEDRAVENLAPGETRTLTFNWTPSAPQHVFAVVLADANDDVGEVNEYNNRALTLNGLIVRPALPAADQAPKPPAGLSGSENATSSVDLSVGELSPSGEAVPLNGTTFTAVVRNDGPDAVADAPVTLRVVTRVGLTFFPEQEAKQNVSLAPGESTTVTLNWTRQPGAYFLEAWATPPSGANDSDPADNHAVAPFTVDPPFPDNPSPPKEDEKATIKEFYALILERLYLLLLIPIIALFYAGGTISEPREDGSLPYLLTRPVPRWLFPITKFVASFAVATLALLAGMALTYALLFGFTIDATGPGFFVHPLLWSLIALFAYGGLFTLLSVTVERPYLIGLAFVLGWEVAASLFVEWVHKLTIRNQIETMIRGNPDVATDGWLLQDALQWLPIGTEARTAFMVLLGIGIVSVLAAAVVMKRREYEV